MAKYKLYDYQQEMLDSIISVLTKPKEQTFFDRTANRRRRSGSSVMVQMPTGTGKTYVMAALVRWALENLKAGRQKDGEPSDGEVWIVAHRRELVEQIQETLDKFSLMYGDTQMALKTRTRIRVVSIQWLNRHVGELEGKPCLIIVDEAHHAIADSYQDLFTLFPCAHKVGMTATPCRMKKESFTKLFAKLLTSPSTKDFIRRGYLAPYDYVVIGRFSQQQITIDALNARGADGDYSIKEMDEKLNVPQSIKQLYESLRKYAHGKQGIVYAINIDHAQAIARYYEQMGLRAVALDSSTPAGTRKKNVEAFKNGQLDCLVNVNLFDEGFDCPEVEFIQMARPTLSLAKYLQMVGRGLRKSKSKKACVIIDNVGNYRKFGLPDRERDWKEMFHGYKAGKGAVLRNEKSRITVLSNDMVKVADHENSYENMTYSQRRVFLKDVEPFEEKGNWGLRVGNTVVLKPRYRHISPFVGQYAVFEFAPGKMGLLCRDGRMHTSPRYYDLRLLSGDTMAFRYNKGGDEFRMPIMDVFGETVF